VPACRVSQQAIIDTRSNMKTGSRSNEFFQKYLENEFDIKINNVKLVDKKI
jgi:hypothetical protein